MRQYTKFDNGFSPLNAAKTTSDGTVLAPTMTCTAFFQYWLGTKTSLRASTYQGYRTCMNRHLIPAFGSLRVNELTREQIEALFQKKLKEGELNEKGLRNLRNVLRPCLELAVIEGILPRNPAEDIQTPTPLAPGIRTLNTAEQQILYYALNDEDSNEALCIFLILGTGATLGEALAMQCGDVDLDKRLVNIRNKRILTRSGWNNVPNEGAECRQAPILPPLLRYLERHPLGPPDQPLIYRRGCAQYDTSSFGKCLHRKMSRLKISATAINLRDTYAIYVMFTYLPGAPSLARTKMMEAMGFEAKSNIYRKYEQYVALYPDVYQL